MKRIFVFCLINLAPILIFAQENNNSAIDLRFNLSKGSTYNCTVGMDMDMNQTVMGQDIKIKTQSSYNYAIQVLKDSLSWKRISAKIVRVKMNSEALGNKTEVDTDNPTVDATGSSKDINEVFNAIKGSVFEMLISSNGIITNITGFSEMNDRLKKTMPKGGGQYLDENTFKQSMEQIFGGYPDHAVKVGDTWMKSVTMKNQGIDILSENTYKLESVGNKEVMVSLHSNLSSAGGIDAGGVHSDINMKGKTEGMIHYSYKTGMPMESNMNTTMDMNVKANGMEIPMKMTLKTTVNGAL